ncbi:MAG: hypothetical protein FWF66_07065 [Candidatus Bathyarchaeota archaeon]|nr:hypothetical protein [Candidatus Termiticorpusculum sp.]
MSKNKKPNQKSTILIGLSIAIIVTVIGVLCFSYALETLDLKADELGIEEEPIYDPPFPDYNIADSENQWSNLAIGIASTLLLFIAAFTVAKLLSHKRSNT